MLNPLHTRYPIRHTLRRGQEGPVRHAERAAPGIQRETHMFTPKNDTNPPQPVDCLIFHQFDAAKTSPGGIDTVIRGILKYTHPPTSIAVVGVDTTADDGTRSLGTWEIHHLGKRTIYFLPVARFDPANQNRRIPHTLRLVAGLVRYRARIPRARTVQCHRMDTALATRLLLPAPLMYFIHTQVGGTTGSSSDSFWRFLGKIHPTLEKTITQGSSRVYAFSPERISQVQQWNPIAELSPTWWDPEQLKATQQPHETPDPYRILWVGRIEKLKDPDLAVAAIRELVHQYPEKPWSLHFYGPGTQTDHLKAVIAAQDSPVAHRIHVHGRVEPEEITRQQARSGVFLMTSFPGYEGFPTVIVESLATGLPVVVTDGADPGHLVRDGVNGFVTNRDARTIAERIAESTTLDRSHIPATVSHLSAPRIVNTIMATVGKHDDPTNAEETDIKKAARALWNDGLIMRRSRSGVKLNELPLQTGPLPTVTEHIDRLRLQESPQLVVTANVDQVIHLKKSTTLRQAYSIAGLRLIDGMPLVWVAKALGDRHAHRHTGADLLPTYAKLSAERGLRLVITGGADAVVERAAENLRKANPGSDIRTVPFPFLTSSDDPRSAEVVEALQGISPDIVFLCLGSPKQEDWFLTWRDELPMAVYIGAGAAVDFAAGARKRAPLYIQRASLEWVWRVAQEPRRLVGRYFLDGPKFLPVAVRSLIHR